ncbi:MAG: cell envelope integrity protein TolA [Nitrospirae bacterium]|nr:cell envelope integrity protein TolA [Nitrospirota bacterium]
MKYSRSIGKEPSLLRIVLVSVILHLIFVAMVTIPTKPKTRDYRPFSVKLVGPIEKYETGTIIQPPVEIKSKEIVKKVTIIEKATTPKVVKPIPQPKADMEVEIAKEAERLRAITKLAKTLEQEKNVAKEIERLRAISKLTKTLEQEKKREIQIRKERTIGTPKSAEVTGAAGESEDIVFYEDIIRQKIWGYWVHPNHNISGLETIISVIIRKNGEIKVREVEKSSGDLLFDRSAIKAISKANPLPPPPDGEMEIGLRFIP